MPIYEYQCRECQHYLDALQKIGEAPLSTCPSCGRETLKRLLSAPRFRLKGGGWYETDFKTGNKRNVTGDDAAKDGDKTPAKKDGADKADKTDKTDTSPVAAKSDDKAGKTKTGSGTATSKD